MMMFDATLGSGVPFTSARRFINASTVLFSCTAAICSRRWIGFMICPLRFFTYPYGASKKSGTYQIVGSALGEQNSTVSFLSYGQNVALLEPMAKPSVT